MAFFVASLAYVLRSIVPQPIPKICPQRLRSHRVLAWTNASDFIEHLLGREGLAVVQAWVSYSRQRMKSRKGGAAFEAEIWVEPPGLRSGVPLGSRPHR